MRKVQIYINPNHSRIECECEERKRNMSFHCIFMKEDIAYLGADSRKNFTDGSYSDNHQKIFINRNLKMVWTMTGITEYRNINYFYIVNMILNNPKASMLKKVYTIQDLMNPITEKMHQETQEDSYFDLFITTVENGELVTYTIESKNGQADEKTNRRHWGNYLEASGVHTDMRYRVNESDLIELSEIDMTQKVNNLISDVIEANKKCKSNTVGGDIYVATIDNKGNIFTYVNGRNSDFRIM